MYKEDKSTPWSNHSWTFVSINKEIAWSFIRYLFDLERCRSSINPMLILFIFGHLLGRHRRPLLVETMYKISAHELDFINKMKILKDFYKNCSRINSKSVSSAQRQISTTWRAKGFCSRAMWGIILREYSIS